MAITPTDFEKIWSTNASTPAYTFNDSDYLEGWDFVGNLPPTRAQWNAIQKLTDEKMKYVFDNFGAPLIANTVADMTLENRVYVYMGSEVGYTAGDWYYYDEGTSAWVDGGVYNAVAVQTDKTLSISDEPADAKVTGDRITALDNVQHIIENVYVNDLTQGRINVGSIDTTATYIAYSPTMRATGDTWYFDTTQFRLLIANYQNSTDSNPASIGNWITTSPYSVPKGRPYYKLMVSRLTSSGTINIATAEATTYQKIPVANKMIDEVTLSSQRLHTVYVSDATGSDSNAGDSANPFKTIQKAIDSGASKILVEEGTYSNIILYNKDYPIYIGLWDYSGTNKKIKITTNDAAGDVQGVNIGKCLDVTLSDIWVDHVQRHLFRVTNTQKVVFNRCIASNNSTSAYMGFSINNTNAFFYDCLAYNIAQDGFNFHDNGNSLMHNCVAHDCADDGVSHHDNCTGSIVGGEFYNCGKGGVASPTYGADINVYDVYAHDNAFGLFAEGLSNKPIKCRVSNCAFLNNTYDIYGNYGEVIGWNNVYNTLRNPSGSYVELHSNS